VKDFAVQTEETAAVSSLPFGSALLDLCSSNLHGFVAERIDKPDLRKAAVALVIRADPQTGQPCILLTLRPRRLNRHAGQYALPGGRLDAGETVEQAALRELHEELGLDLEAGSIIGRLDDYPTRSGFCIAPIVVWGGEGGELVPDPGEVETVIHIPIAELDNPDIPVLSEGVPGGHPVLSVRLPVLGHTMWAPTAAILYQFRETVMNGRATRVAHFDEPEFAWK
jgi:8-oxo-dGTP pyrophosphatase MutT (NUDIX family)